MAAMLVLVWLSSLVMMMMSSYAASAKIVTARSGEAVLLSSDLQETELEAGQDFRWTHPQLVVSTKKDDTCHNKHCELLKNGSLRLSQVQPADSGNYSLQVFSKSGILQSTKVFQLRVEDGSSSSSSSSSSSVLVPVLICCLLLLLFPIIFFILMRRRRRSQTTKTNTGHLEENVYVVMHGNHGKETKDAEKEEKEEDSHYVDCNRVVSMKTPVTQQMSVDEEDIYV
ncbi:uncharacterized protein LOC115578028 [Sparus aurata]|uniref:uncharacterized protein LOC115578028 n=1 Tax=Sparus aurata TaxID=8175 RepID=UPI0011C1224F|nr:uncharacterized protein LOC115578028 [Sparus aurata]